MKTIFTLLLFLTPFGFALAQCPSAGQDTSATYCPNEFFDVADLRSADADTNGMFIDPAGDTMTNTVISLTFPGQYSYFYHVTDTNCPVDTAKYIVIITTPCWGEISENVLEKNTLIQTNPVKESLILKDDRYDRLEILDLSGRSVLVISPASGTHIQVSELESGNYLLIHEKNGIRQFQRFIKI